MSTWIARRTEEAVAADLARSSGALAGLRLGVKDNIDVVGLPTTAGCPAFSYDPDRSASVVERLEGAGAVVVGKTNLDQFATGLVGTRTPYGALASPLAPDHVAGGSSSGSAVSVATDEADIALGTDTAGSGRVPAAFCGVVGLKPTRGWLSTRGVVPACRSLDCVSVFARDVPTAAAATLAAAGFDPDDAWSRRRPDGHGGRIERVGVPSEEVLARWCHPLVVEAFGALDLAGAGFEVLEVDLTAYLAAGELVYGGALVAERYDAVGAFVEAHPDDVDPTVRSIVMAAGPLRASAFAADLRRLTELRRAVSRIWSVVDAVVVPTAPNHPTLDDVAAAPLQVNAALGRFTNGCNPLDWCAAAVPAGRRRDGLPFGVTVLGPAWTDQAVWDAAEAVTGGRAQLTSRERWSDRAPGEVHLAVAGAHLAGQPLNHQLTDRGGRLVACTTTAPAYRMVALATDPPKPGLARVGCGGAAVEVEVWALDHAAFGAFVAEVPPPLAIGTVDLADGTSVKGFLCEEHAMTGPGVVDVTHLGGWRAWLAG